MLLASRCEVTIEGKRMREQKSHMLELSFAEVEALRSAVMLALGTPEGFLDPEDRNHLMTIKKKLLDFQQPRPTGLP